MSARKLVLFALVAVFAHGLANAQSDGDNGPNEALLLTDNARLEGRSISPAGDQDWLTFVLGEPTTVAVETNRRPAGGIAMSITIRDAQLNEVLCETFSCDSEALAIDLPAGQFYIVLESLSAGLTVPNYFVAVSFHPIKQDTYEPDNTMGQATPLPNATISRGHSIGPINDDDWFSYQTLAGRNPAYVVMEGNSGVRQITFEVFESDGDAVFLGGNNFVPQNRLFFGGGLLPDTYFIRVREWEREEFNDSQAVPDYQFTIWDISQPDPYEDDDTPGTASAARVQGSDHTPAGHQQYRNIMPQGDVDWVRFYVEDADEVIVRAFSVVGPETTVAIYNNTGQTLLAGPDNSGFVDLDNPADGYYLARISLPPGQNPSEHLYDLDITSIPIPRLTPGSLSGVVFSGSKQSPLTNATVTVSGAVNVSASTDNAGVYLVPALPQGAYTVRAAAPGFAMGQTQANVGPAITAADIALQPSTGQPEDLDGNGTVDAVDVQLVINGALGVGLPADVNNDGETDAVDVQIVINAALGVG
jgi:hypothetical protein